MTPARRHRERTLAALQGAANPQFDQARANAYELQLMQLAEHRRTLKGIRGLMACWPPTGADKMTSSSPSCSGPSTPAISKGPSTWLIT